MNKQVSINPAAVVEMATRRGSGQERTKGQIQTIVDAIMAEPGFFYSGTYALEYPAATVQGVFSILKAAKVIEPVAGTYIDEDGKSKVDRGKYILRATKENMELVQARKEIEQLRAKLASLT